MEIFKHNNVIADMLESSMLTLSQVYQVHYIKRTTETK